jgi:hypothetical protein
VWWEFVVGVSGLEENDRKKMRLRRISKTRVFRDAAAEKVVKSRADEMESSMEVSQVSSAI